MIFSTNNILTKLLSYSYHEWEKDIAIRDEIKNWEKAFLKFSLKHTLVDHLGSVVTFLCSFKLDVKDFGNWNVENLHCQMNQIKKFKGHTYVRYKQGEFIIKYYSSEEEIIKKVMDFINFPNIEELQNDISLVSYRENRILERKQQIFNRNSDQMVIRKGGFEDFWLGNKKKRQVQ